MGQERDAFDFNHQNTLSSDTSYRHAQRSIREWSLKLVL
jgi:hypothetical protein